MGVAVKTMSGKRDKGRGLTTRGARIKRLEARLETEKDERILEAIRAQLAAFGRGRVGSVYTRALIATPAYKRLRWRSPMPHSPSGQCSMSRCSTN